MKVIKGFFMAWGCFCSVPCPWKVWDEKARQDMLVMLPVLGLLMGFFWYAIGVFLMWLNLPLPMVAAVLTIYPFLVTGFIHLDGFMDCSDAICSRAPLEKRLAILKDSHVGAFAVIWAIVMFMFFYAAMWSWLISGGQILILILIPMASRTVSVVNVLTKKRLGTSQYNGMEAKDTKRAVTVIVSLALAMAIYAFLTGLYLSLAAAGFAIAGSAIAVHHGIKNLGGMSGDISGYGIVWGELAAVVSAAIIL